MSWCFSDEVNAYGDTVLDSMYNAGLQVEAVVPSLWSLEVANVLLVAERKHRITQAQTTRAITLLCSLPIVVDERTAAQAMGSTLALAREHNLSAYDAAYLELAMREGLPLATIDEQLSEVAPRSGVEIYLSAASSEP